MSGRGRGRGRGEVGWGEGASAVTVEVSVQRVGGGGWEIPRQIKDPYENGPFPICFSPSKRVLALNFSYENEFENFAGRLVLTERQRATRKCPRAASVQIAQYSNTVFDAYITRPPYIGSNEVSCINRECTFRNPPSISRPRRTMVPFFHESSCRTEKHFFFLVRNDKSGLYKGEKREKT